MSRATKSTILVVAVICVSLVELGSACTGSWLDSIDQQLRNRFNSIDVQKNIDELKKYVEETLKSSDHAGRIASKDIQEFIEKFTKAGDVYESPKCERGESELLVSLDRLIYGRVLKAERFSSKCFHRIKNVFDRILKKHVWRCEMVHRSDVLMALEQINADVRRKVEGAMIRLVQPKNRLNSKRVGGEEAFDILQTDTLLDQYVLDRVKTKIERFASLQSEQLVVAERNKAVKMMNEILENLFLSACNEYVSAIDKFASAASLDTLYQSDFQGSNEEVGTLNTILATNHLCKIALEEKHKLVDKLVAMYLD